VSYVRDAAAVLDAFSNLIDAAEHNIILQMYLFARNGDQTTLLHRPGAEAHAELLADRLIARKQARPDLPIVVLLDSNTPANPARTRRRGELIRTRLERAGILVLTACLFHNHFDPRRRRLPAMNFHLDHAKTPLADWVEHQNRWQSLHNVEDHRKNLVIDRGRAGIITSHNFFDPAFDWYENGFVLAGPPARQLWRIATRALATASTIPQRLGPADHAVLAALLATPPTEPTDDERDDGELVENEAIRGRLEALCAGAGPGDPLLAATTYFSDLPAFAALEAAARRGARVRVLIDSIHALPLPPVYSWLTCNLANHQVIQAAIRLQTERPDHFQLRVHDSRAGTMMHLKTLARLGRSPLLLGGQANFTPNSFSGAWLETDLETRDPDVIAGFTEHFEDLWRQGASRTPAAAGALRTRGISTLLTAFARVGLRP
jgi:phosphatidylserine/phosphatidylglycerophosphate/cardiolipin synthase-like enzyme